MTAVLVCALILLQPKAGIVPSGPSAIEKYLRRCEEAKTAVMESVAREIKTLEAIRGPTSDQLQKLQAARTNLQRLQKDSAPLAKLPLPPEKDNVGVFAPIDERLGRSVDVLEVVDEDDVIIRAWYWSTAPLPKEPTAAEDATFVDLWVHGIDTSRLTARMPAQLPQVFQVTGNKLFDTTCGKRSLPLLEPVDLKPFTTEK